MAQRPKLTADRQDRLIAILGLGESLEAACRAVEVSTTAVRKCAQRGPLFAARLEAARERGRGATADDWELVARVLERQHPERWALPNVPLDFNAPP
jgi:hypothetical protein